LHDDNDKNQRLKDELRTFARKQAYENKCNDHKYDEIFGGLRLNTLKNMLNNNNPKTEAQERFTTAQFKLRALIVIFPCVLVLAIVSFRVTETKVLLLSLPNFTISMSSDFVCFLLLVITLIIGSFFEKQRKSAFIDLQKNHGISEMDAKLEYKRQFVSNT
jgi:hypothetical protein